MLSIRHKRVMWRYLCFTYQTVHTVHCVIGVVQGVGQLVHAIIGLTVAIETHTHGDAAERRGTGTPSVNSWGEMSTLLVLWNMCVMLLFICYYFFSVAEVKVWSHRWIQHLMQVWMRVASCGRKILQGTWQNTRTTHFMNFSCLIFHRGHLGINIKKYC